MDVRPSESGLDNVVVSVQWEVTAHDPDVGDTAGTQGRTNLNPVTETFIQYPDLTEADVFGWVWEIMGESQKAELEAFADYLLLNNRKPPITQLPLPWA